jgi:polyketide biosynthesis enoyl-CoA hydratase PksH
MDIVTSAPAYDTLRVRWEPEICFVQIHRPLANNAIGGGLIDELTQVLHQCAGSVKIVVLEGSPEVFCFGADFAEIQRSQERGDPSLGQDPQALYTLWTGLAFGPFISVAHVRGKANAGGVGFVAACDVVLSDEQAVFSLSELLFGLMPACVLPFLIRRIGSARANYMTLMTAPVAARQARDWGLVDVCEENSENLLRRQLLRLRRSSRAAIAIYKEYLHTVDEIIDRSKPMALQANTRVFSDRDNLEKITRYVKTGKFPWE